MQLPKITAVEVERFLDGWAKPRRKITERDFGSARAKLHGTASVADVDQPPPLEINSQSLHPLSIVGLRETSLFLQSNQILLN